MMTRQTLIYFRLFSPAIALLFTAAFLAILSRGSAGLPILAALQPLFDIAIATALLGAAGIIAWSGFRLYRWEEGHGFFCPHCGSPLGSERIGTYSAYRKCLGCAVNINERKYIEG